MPLLNPRVARRANERRVADPVGPIIAKCRVFVAPALAAAECCHGSSSGQITLAYPRERTRAGFRRPFNPTVGLALRARTRLRWTLRFVGGAGKPRRSMEHIPPKRLIPATRHGE